MPAGPGGQRSDGPATHLDKSPWGAVLRSPPMSPAQGCTSASRVRVCAGSPRSLRTRNGRGWRGRTLPRLTFGVALEPVVRDRLPLAGIVDVRVPLRPNAVARIEEPQADAPHVAGVRILAPERTAADGAEALRPTIARRVLAHELLAGEQAERAGRYPQTSKRTPPHMQC